jgi:rfaE bifunctional protein nucleotidyltransferase chain/domain
VPSTLDATRSKIKDLEALPAILAPLRDGRKKIVHCHGVFDLLHIGHIRHFAEAKALGDVLVVTVTPDRYVNKGPHRPVFTEALRAEAIAALGTVDFVAINKWPMAVETIAALKPDLYVKGPDYRDAGKDHTGGITLEEAAVRSNGGQLVCTDDVTFSSSGLINRYLPTFSKEVIDYLADFRRRHPPAEAIEYLQQARRLKTLVIGEAIIDEYQYCEAIGKSSKEPMLAMKHLWSETFAGGILAVANHVSNFCDDVGLVTLLGSERSREAFIRENLHANVDAVLLHRPGAPTLVKRRFVESYFFTKLLEIYEMNDDALGQEEEERLCSVLEERVSQYDLVIVFDFGHGMLSRAAIDLIAGNARFLAVNAQSNAGNIGYHTVSRYPRADYVCIAENEIRLEARDRRGDVRSMVLNLSRQMSADRIVVTRGKSGCLCYARDEGFCEPPALAGQVIDRMGAGDALLSVTALCVAQGAPMEVVGFIGNAVGAQAVATVGHRASVNRVALIKQIESLLK